MAESFPESSSTPTFPVPPPEGLASRLFFSEDRLRSGWSLLLYAGFGLLIWFPLAMVVSLIGGFREGSYSPQSVALGELVRFAAVYGAALVMARLERLPAGVYGLPLPQAFGKYFWLGIFLGLCEVSLLVGLIAVFGGYSFGSSTLRGTSLIGWGLLWAVAFLLVGFSEEFMFRGYVQYTLTRGIGFWPGAVCLSLLFGAIHLRNPGEGLVGAADAAVAGLVWAFALRRTGSLWLTVGWHACFDFGETFLFSVPDSGYMFDHHLSNAVLHGPAWLTGGTVGPEGSAFGFLTMGLSVLLIHFLFPVKKQAAGAPQAATTT
ncbi:MAG TPA: type II CAAX endopeptidase family protein [Candidatus Acidoferrum sp.]|nr:type II CAAX endopeptidase family protein [Candidatus Acidoferrum sp.]